MTSSATQRLARFAKTTELDDMPESARRVASWAMLDAVACALAGHETPVATRVRGFVLDDRATGNATVWGSNAGSTVSGAALANGTAAHALDFDDVCWAMNAHPSCVLGPAAFAVAESVDASGSQLLRAYCLGFEAEARLGEVMGHRHYAAGWHPTATLGTLGATVAAGVLLDLSEEALRSALGIACSKAAGTRVSFGTDTKPLHAGMAAEAGVTAALLAARGVTASQSALEASMGLFDLYAAEGGEVRTDLDRLCLLDPGIEHKPYPSCRFTHRIIEAVCRIRARNAKRPRRIVCRVDPFSRQILRYSVARTGLEAKFSMQASAALAWLEGPPTVASFRDRRIQEQDVQDLCRRVELVDGSADAEEATITFDDGTEDREAIQLPLGHPQRPIPRAEHLDKIAQCARVRLSAAAVERLVESMTHLEDVPDVRGVARLLVLPAGDDQDPAR